MFPRFLKSIFYSKLTSRVSAIYPLPPASQLTLKYPKFSGVLSWDDADITVEKLAEVPTLEMLHDYILYHHFLIYARSKYFEENVLFGRALAIYDCLWKHYREDHPGVKDLKANEDIDNHIWVIYRYFIAVESSCEISLSTSRRKFIMHRLADPVVGLFQTEEDAAYKIVKQYYISYSRTPEFAQLVPFILEKKSEIAASALSGHNHSHACVIQ